MRDVVSSRNRKEANKMSVLENQQRVVNGSFIGFGFTIDRAANVVIRFLNKEDWDEKSQVEHNMALSFYQTIGYICWNWSFWLILFFLKLLLFILASVSLSFSLLITTRMNSTLIRASPPLLLGLRSLSFNLNALLVTN